MSESLRDLIKMDIEAYEEGLEMEQKSTESTGNPPRPDPTFVLMGYRNTS